MVFYGVTSGGIRLCSTVVEQHRPNLRVALEAVGVHVAVTLHSRRVVCRIDSERFGCNKYCIRTRWRSLLLLSCVAFSPRHASSPLLTSVFFAVTRRFLCTAMPRQSTGEDCDPPHCVQPLLRLWSCLPPSQPNAVLQSTWDLQIPCMP